MNDFAELKRQGLSIQAISSVTGFDRKTVRKYLLDPEEIPEYGPRPSLPSKLDAHKQYLEERLKAGVWNAVVLLRELKERGYDGGYTILKDWLQPQRESASVVAVRRFETPAGRQAQVDWGHLGSLEMEGGERQLWGFTFTLGYSRMMMAAAALNQKLGTLLRMHEEAFRQLGGIPQERRVHGTTHEAVMARWDAEQMSLQPLSGRLPYPYLDEELRKVARDAFVAWQGSRYSVPWGYAGKEVWVRELGSQVEVHYGGQQIAVHAQAPRKHLIMRNAEHHEGIPLGARQERKTLVHLRQTAPVVEIRPLAAYESVAAGGAR